MSSHNRYSSRLRASRNGFILEPHYFTKNANLPKPARIMEPLKWGEGGVGCLLNTAGSKVLQERQEGSRCWAKSEASGMMQPWCSEIAG